MRLFRQLQRSDKAPQTDSHGAQIGDLVDFDLRIQLVAALQYLPHLVRRDGIQSASEGNELYQLYIRVRNGVPRGGIQAGMVRPLVQHMDGCGLSQSGDAVLCHDGKAERCRQPVDAVPDLRVDVIRSPGKDHDAAPALSRPRDG